MTTIVAGEGLGLSGSASAGRGAAAELGQGGGGVAVNVANGNLVLQVRDEWLASKGVETAVTRTYNSQGVLDDDNADNWRIGLYRSVVSLTGTLNAAGSTVVRVDGDGTRRVYAYDGTLAKYVNKDGEGAHDTLSYSSSTSKWTWTDGDSRVSETYDWVSGSGKLLEVADTAGNKLTYSYSGSLLTLVTDASGEKTYLDYSGANLTQVRIVKSDASTSTAVRYGYDASNRLTSVTVDLSPDDNSIADGKTYVTTYSYDGTSKRVAGITQSDGTSLAIAYTQVGGRYCVSSITDALGRVTRYSYSQAAWGSAAALESLGVAVNDPQVKLDASGNGWALWREGGNLWASRFGATTGTWGTPVNLSTSSNAVTSAQLALEPGGNAVATWVQSDGTAASIYASRYNAATGSWSAPALLDNLGTSAADPQVAVNAAGKAIVVWRQPAAGTTTPNNLYASRFDGSTWATPTLLETNAADITGPATVALDVNGNASVAWLQDATANIYLTRYTASSNTWSTPSATAIESGSTAASNVQLVFDAKGNGQVIYIQGGNLYARSYTASNNTWGTAKLLENSSNVVVSAQLSVSANGNALVSWIQSNGSANSVYARRCIDGSWLNSAANADTGDLLETLSTVAVSAQGAIADNGDAVVAWRQPTSGSLNSLYAARYMGAAWQAAELLENNANDITAAPVVALDGRGAAQVLWQQSDGTAASLYGARFSLAQTNQTDALGQVTRISTDSRGRLAEVRTLTARTLYTYDAAGNLIGQADGLGQVTVYGYDANGNQTLVRDALGNTVVRSYDASNQLLNETAYLVPDADGWGSGQPGTPLTTRYAYDAQSRLRFVVSAAGRVTQYTYNSAGQRVSELQYAGNTYDVSSLAATATLSESTLSTWAAGSSIDKTRVLRTDNTYDFRGQLASSTAYAKTDSSGAGVSDGTQATTNYVYDARGRLLQSVAPKGVATTGVSTDFVTSFTYDGLGRVLTSTDTLGRVTTTTYDAANKKVSVTQANGLVGTSTFDAAGQLLSVSYSDGSTTLQTTRFWYDASGRLLMTQDATGVRAYSLYDAAGRKVADIDALGQLTEYTYDAEVRLVRSLQYATALSASVLAGLVDADGNPTNPALSSVRPGPSTADRSAWNFYDAAGRLVKTVDAEGAVVQTFYDGAGRVTDVLAYATTVATSGITTSTRAGDSAVSPAANGADRRTRMFYDSEGKLLATLDAAGYLSENEYDGAGRLVHTIGRATQTSSSYWASGTLAQLRPAASSADQHAWMLYDGRDNVVAEVDAEGYLTERVYDANGNQTQQIAYATKALVAPASITTATTLAALRPTSSSQDQSSSWTYTELDQVASATDAQGTVTRYTYDEMGRVVKTEAAQGTSEVRTLQTRYDKLGRVTAELSAEGAAALAALGSPTQAQIDAIWSQYAVSHTYDAASRRTSSSDALGNKTRYYYDADDRLVYTVNALGEVQENRYDTLGNLSSTVAYATRIGSTTLAGMAGGLADSAVKATVNALADSTKDSVQAVGYDRRGLATSSTDALGNTDTRSYNAFGELVSSTDRIDASTTVTTNITRDKRGAVTQAVEDAGGLNRSSSTVYDAFGRAVQSTDGNGKTSSVQYDRLGRVVQTTDALGGNRSSTYDAFDRVLTQTDALGNTTSYVYDASARSMKVTTPEGVSVTTKFNRHGQVISVTDGLGNTSTRSYDANGNLSAEADALGHGDSNAYDKAGRLIRTTDAAGTVTTLAYDAAGRVLTRTVDASGLNLVTTYEYDALGRTVKVTDPSGLVVQNSYDKQGQLTQVAVDPTGLNLRTAYTYDAQGKTLTVTQGYGTSAATTVRYGYDKLGRRTSEAVDPSGLNLRTTYAYDANGNMVTRTDGSGVVTRYAYDAEDRLVYTVDGLRGVTKTEYDAEGRVVKTTAYATPIGSLASYTVSSIAAALSSSAGDQVQRSVYDKDGHLVYAISALGQVVRNTYDANGRVTQTTAYANAITVPASPTPANVASAITADATRDATVRHVYDAAGREVYTVDALGGVTRIDYDNADHAVKVTAYATPIGSLASYTASTVAAALSPSSARDRVSYSVFDTAGRLAYSVDALGYVVRAEYDGGGRVVKTTAYATAITVPASPTAANVAAAITADAARDQVMRHVFDAAGREVYTIDGLGYVVRNTYDAAGRVVRSVQYAGAITVPATVSETNVAAAVTADSARDRSACSVYDAAGRLAYAIDAEGYVTAYTYDGAGRPSGSTRYPASVGVQASSPSVATLQGLLPASVPSTAVVKTQTYDAAGRLLSSTDGEGIVTRRELDAFGRVTKVTVGYGRSDAASTAYAYDTEGRLVQAVAGSGSLNLTTRYQYDAFGQRVAVIDPRGVEAAEQDTDWAKAERKALGYVDGSGNALLASALSATQKQALLDRYTSRSVYDALGRKTRDTDALGNATVYGYDAFGRQVKLTDPRGNTAYFYYDRLGRQTLQVDPLGFGTATTYDFSGAVLSQTRHAAAATGSWSETSAPSYTADSAKDSTTRWTYDRLGRKTGQTDAEGYTQAWTYDGLDNVASQTNAVGGTTSYAYDRRGLLVSETLPITSKKADGTDAAVVNQYTYDARGNRLSRVEAAGLPEQRTTTWTYDENDRVTSQRGTAVSVLDDSFNSTTATPTETYSYDARGNRILVDANGRKTYAWYDAADRKIASADAVGTLTRWSLDAAGNAIRQDVYGDAVTPTTASVPTPVNAANVRTTYSAFDANNRLTKTWQIANNLYDHVNGLRSNVEVATSNTYDANGNLVRVVDPNGNSTWRYYDKLGQLSMQVDAEGYASGWGYDALGNATVERRYAGKLASATLSGLSAGSDTTALRNELLASAEVGKDRITLSSYDRMGRLVRQGVLNVAYASVNATSGALTESSGESVTTNTYNGLGLVLTTTDANGSVVRATYDALGRQTARQLPDFTDHLGTAGRHALTTMVYDGLGNLVSSTDKGAAAADDRTVRYAYNANGWKTSETDAEGNTTDYSYNVHGEVARQTQVRLESVANDTDWKSQPLWSIGVNASGANVIVTNPLAGGGGPQAFNDDWNRDNLVDVLWYDKESGSNRMYYQNSDGTFIVDPSPIAPSLIDDGNGIVTGDFNGDGWRDVMWYDQATGKTSWFLNGNGQLAGGGEQHDPIAVADLKGGAGIKFGDWNGDGKLDMLWYSGDATAAASSNASAGMIRLYTSGVDANGQLTFTRSDLNAASYASGTGVLWTGDWNGDGKSEFAWISTTGNGANNWFVKTDTGYAVTTDAIARSAISGGTSLATADFTGDGKVDFLWYDRSTGGNKVFVGQGGGVTSALTFKFTPLNASSNNNSIDPAQLKGGTGIYLNNWTVGDSKADLMWYDQASGTTRWFSSNGNGFFTSISNPVTAANQAGAKSMGDQRGNGIRLREWTSYTYDALGRQIKADGYQQINTRYNAWGEVSARGYFGYYYENAEYDTLGRLWRGNTGDGITRAYLYDAAGNATLKIESLGASLKNMTLAQMMASTDTRATISVYDRRGQGVQTIQPQADANEITAITGFTMDVAATRLVFKNQAIGTQQLKLRYRVAGGSAYTEAILPLYQSHDNWFAFDWSALAAGTYDYSYEATDSSGRVLNADSGQFKIDGSNSSILSQTNWLATGAATPPSLSSVLSSSRAGTLQQIAQKREYNAFGDITAEIDGASRRTDLSYNTMGQLVLRTQPETDATLANGFVQRVRPQTRYYYDLTGQVVGTRDPNGNLTTQRYLNAFVGEDGQLEGRVAQEYHADGGSRSYGYDEFGDRRRMTDELGQVTAYGYDKNDNLVLVDRTGANDDRYQYDINGWRIGHTDALGGRETWKYDAIGNVTQAISAQGRITDTRVKLIDSTWNTSTSMGSPLAPTTEANALSAPVGYVRMTTDANGYSVWEITDPYGRLRGVRDMANRWNFYTYNQGGQLLSVKGSNTSRSVSYAYYYNGDLKTITDNALGTVSRYGYDKAGNRSFEAYTKTGAQGSADFYQYNRIEYDELNRVRQSWGSDVRVHYEYDAAGNRRRVDSSYRDAISGAVSTQDYWYLYDSMGRFTTTKGTLVGGRATNAGDAARIQRGSTGVDLQYDLASQRKVALYGSDGHREAYAYNSDGLLTTTTIDVDGNTATTGDSRVRAQRGYDSMGRVTSYKEWSASGTLQTDESTTYDADGKALKVNEAVSKRVTSYFYLADGTLRQTEAVVNGDTANTLYTGYNYALWDTYKQNEILVKRGSGTWGDQTGYSRFTYDVNGNVQKVVDTAGNRSLQYVTNGEGLVLRRDEYTSASPAAGATPLKTHNFYYVNGLRVGDTGNDGQSQEDYAQSLAHDKGLTPEQIKKRYKPVSVADFDQSYDPVNRGNSDATPGRYTVRVNDTLQSIARSVWGDGSLWYLIADANGLSATSALVAGQTLVIPNKVTNVHNNTSTFQVYDPFEALGDVNPTLPQAPAPQVKKVVRPTHTKKPKKASCGKMLLGIVVSVVAIAAAAFVAPMVAPLLTPVLGTTLGGVAAGATAGLAATAVQGAGGVLMGERFRASDLWRGALFGGGVATLGMLGAAASNAARLGVAGHQAVQQLVQGPGASLLARAIYGRDKGSGMNWLGSAAVSLLAAPVANAASQLGARAGQGLLNAGRNAGTWLGRHLSGSGYAKGWFTQPGQTIDFGKIPDGTNGGATFSSFDGHGSYGPTGISAGIGGGFSSQAGINSQDPTDAAIRQFFFPTQDPLLKALNIQNGYHLGYRVIALPRSFLTTLFSRSGDDFGAAATYLKRHIDAGNVGPTYAQMAWTRKQMELAKEGKNPAYQQRSFTHKMFSMLPGVVRKPFWHDAYDPRYDVRVMHEGEFKHLGEIPEHEKIRVNPDSPTGKSYRMIRPDYAEGKLKFGPEWVNKQPRVPVAFEFNFPKSKDLLGKIMPMNIFSFVGTSWRGGPHLVGTKNNIQQRLSLPKVPTDRPILNLARGVQGTLYTGLLLTPFLGNAYEVMHDGKSLRAANTDAIYTFAVITASSQIVDRTVAGSMFTANAMLKSRFPAPGALGPLTPGARIGMTLRRAGNYAFTIAAVGYLAGVIKDHTKGQFSELFGGVANTMGAAEDILSRVTPVQALPWVAYEFSKGARIQAMSTGGNPYAYAPAGAVERAATEVRLEELESGREEYWNSHYDRYVNPFRSFARETIDTGAWLREVAEGNQYD